MTHNVFFPKKERVVFRDIFSSELFQCFRSTKRRGGPAHRAPKGRAQKLCLKLCLKLAWSLPSCLPSSLPSSSASKNSKNSSKALPQACPQTLPQKTQKKNPPKFWSENFGGLFLKKTHFLCQKHLSLHQKSKNIESLFSDIFWIFFKFRPGPGGSILIQSLVFLNW